MSSSPDGRSRNLLSIVIIGVIVMVLLVVTISVLFFQEIFLEDRLSLANQPSDSIAHLQPTPDPLNALQSEPQATKPVEQSNQSISIKPTETNELVSQLQPKQIVAGSPKNRPSWTATPIPTNTPSPTPSPIPTFVSDDAYSGLLRPESVGNGEKWIDVNLPTAARLGNRAAAPA